jgi:hypothetical protein
MLYALCSIINNTSAMIIDFFPMHQQHLTKNYIKTAFLIPFAEAQTMNEVLLAIQPHIPSFSLSLSHFVSRSSLLVVTAAVAAERSKNYRKWR